MYTGRTVDFSYDYVASTNLKSIVAIENIILTLKEKKINILVLKMFFL